VFWNCEKRIGRPKCKVIIHTKTGDATVIRRINEHNHSGSAATHEQMLRLLRHCFLVNFFLNVNQTILRAIRARK